MPTFHVTVVKKIEAQVYVRARDADEAKALAWGRLPEHVDEWHCDVYSGTKFKVEQVEEKTM